MAATKSIGQNYSTADLFAKVTGLAMYAEDSGSGPVVRSGHGASGPSPTL
jgi:hypothetical protein